MEIDRDRRATATIPDDSETGVDGGTQAMDDVRPGKPVGSRRPQYRVKPLPFGILCLTLAVPLLLAALWPRAAFGLDVGEVGDRLFLGNVHGDERTAEYAYRWTGRRDEPATLTVPGWGAVQRARLTVRAQALPERGPTELRVLAGGQTVGTLQIDGTMAERSVEIALPANGGDFTLALETPTSRVAGDSRPLGIKLDRLRLEPLERDGGLFWRGVWLPLGLALALIAAVLLTFGGAGGTLALAGRLVPVVAVPLALALALPWALALLPYGLWAGGALVAVRWRERLLGGLTVVWEELDRSRTANTVVAGGIAIYAAIMLPHLLAVPWINHADYADNAVVARNLVQGQGFSVDYVAQFYRDWPMLRHPAETWPPLQPLMIAVAFLLFGVSVGVAKLPNLIVMIGMLWLIYRVGRWLWSPRVGVVAALLVALHPAFFEGVVYPLNDTVFTLLMLGIITLFAYLAGGDEEATDGQGRRIQGLRQGLGWALLGVLGGLLLLAKPSGAILLAGGGVWALWRCWRDGRQRQVIMGGVVAALIALAIYTPWLVRNQSAFGQLFHTTESYDAYLLEYRDWETIYQVYAGEQPLPHRSLLVGYGLDAVSDKIRAQFREAWNDLSGGKVVPALLLPLIIVAGLVARERRQRAALAALAVAVAGYAIFIAVYWHYERRYALFLVPWGALFGAAGLWWLHDRVAEARGRALAGIAALVLIGALLVPQVREVRDDWSASLRTPNSVVVAEWVRDNTPGTAIVMTRNPWEFSFHSERLSVMIPADDLATILAIGAKYGATHLQLDHLTDNGLRRPAIAPLYDGPDEWQGFRKVFDRRDENGEGLLVYEFPQAGR